MKMKDCLIGKRTGNKCHLRWYSRKLGFNTLTGLIAEGMDLVKWRDQVNVTDDLSLINICFQYYCYLLKRYSRTFCNDLSTSFEIFNNFSVEKLSTVTESVLAVGPEPGV